MAGSTSWRSISPCRDPRLGVAVAALDCLDIQYLAMDPDALVILARARALRRVKGMPDVLTLRLEVRVPVDLRGRPVVIEQRLTRRDVARMLAAFDAAG